MLYFYNTVNYYFLKNLQGDVMDLINSSGILVASYLYDAWGKLLSVKDALGDAITSSTNIANINPIRYRGYYYDNETGFYYLQSRYYDPVTGRFLNADNQLSAGDMVGMNLFAYCENNPVNRYDPNGTDWIGLRTGINYGDYSTSSIRYLMEQNDCGINNCKYERNVVNSSLPKTGKPNSSQGLYNPDGTLKQKRWYGPDGSAVRDRDYNYSGNIPFPHDHEWKNGERKKDHLPLSPEYQCSLEPIIGIGIVTICAIGIVAIAADDVTGIGVADDFLLGPLETGIGEGLIMIFG